MNARKFYEVAGIRLAAIASNIRYADRLDLVLIEIARGAAVAGVYTQNAFCAAPVLLAKQHLQTATSRYFLINTGNANAGTGAAGRDDAFRCCQALAELTEVQACSVLPFSTGVIGEPLPVDKIVFGLPEAIDKLSASNWLQAATGILTTDTRPKLASTRLELDGKSVTITGMAKGSGMIKPDMATMLAFVFTDAQIHQQLLEQKLAQAVSHSFNRITVDGDTSTNDSCMLAATGHSQVQIDAGNKSVNEKFDRAKSYNSAMKNRTDLPGIGNRLDSRCRRGDEVHHHQRQAGRIYGRMPAGSLYSGRVAAGENRLLCIRSKLGPDSRRRRQVGAERFIPGCYRYYAWGSRPD